MPMDGAFNLTYEQAIDELTADRPHRRYGIVSARGLLAYALRDRVYTDTGPAGPDGTAHAVQVRLQQGTATTADRYWIRDMTVRKLTDPARA